MALKLRRRPTSGAATIETSRERGGAQTQFLTKPGAGSFKRLLGGRATTLERLNADDVDNGSGHVKADEIRTQFRFEADPQALALELGR